MITQDVLAEALSLLLRQVEGEHAIAVAESDRLVGAAMAAADRVEALKVKREKLIAELRELGVMAPPSPASMVVTQTLDAATQMATLTAGSAPPAAPTQARRSRQAWRNDVIEAITKLLSMGQRKTADEILDSLLQAGVAFDGIANPRHRLVQIMSESHQFSANRKSGWGLRGFEFPPIDETAEVTAKAESASPTTSADDATA